MPQIHEALQSGREDTSIRSRGDNTPQPVRSLRDWLDHLATRERLLVLNPGEVQFAMRLIRRIRDERGAAVFWVEHVMEAIMGVADRVVVLHHGERIAEGPPAAVAEDPRVLDAYLGERVA